MNIIIEILVYSIYIYVLLSFFILIKPTKLIITIFGSIIFFSTWLLYIGCKANTINDSFNRLAISLAYTLGCIIFYYILHYNWYIFKKYSIIKILLLLSPIFYFFAIKSSELLFLCKPYHCLDFITNNYFNEIFKYKLFI